MPMQQVDRRIGLSAPVAAVMDDPRNPDFIVHVRCATWWQCGCTACAAATKT